MSAELELIAQTRATLCEGEIVGGRQRTERSQHALAIELLAAR